MKSVLSACTVVLALCTASGQIMFQGGPEHHGVAISGIDEIEFDKTLWTLETGSRFFSSPVIDNGQIFIGDEAGTFYCVNSRTGKIIWKTKTNGAFHSTGALHAGKVFVNGFDGFLYAFDQRKGTTLWKYETGGEKWQGGKGYWGMKPDTMYMTDPWDIFTSSPVIATTQGQDLLYFGSGDGYVYCLRPENGKLVWKFETSRSVHSTPAISNGKVFVGSWDATMYALDALTGKEIWRYETGKNMGMTGIQCAPTLADGKIFFGARDAFLYALNQDTGELLWKYDAENAWILSTAAYDNGTLYMSTSDSYLVASIDAATGKEKWRTKLHGYVFGSPLVIGSQILTADFTGRYYLLNKSDGSIRSTFATTTFEKNSANVLEKDSSMNFQRLAEGKNMSLYSSTVEVMDLLYTLGPVVSSPAIIGNVAILSSTNGVLYSVSLR